MIPRFILNKYLFLYLLFIYCRVFFFLGKGAQVIKTSDLENEDLPVNIAQTNVSGRALILQCINMLRGLMAGMTMKMTITQQDGVPTSRKEV